MLTKITVAQNQAALSSYTMRGLYFQAVIFAATILILEISCRSKFAKISKSLIKLML